jgi:hypothetical protein
MVTDRDREELDGIRGQLTRGVATFAEIQVRIGTLQEKNRELEARLYPLEPKAIDSVKVAGLVVTLSVLVLGSVWTLSELFNARPTRAELENAIGSHEHEKFDDSMQALRDRATKLEIRLERTESELSRLSQTKGRRR